MLRAADAEPIADRFGLGEVTGFAGPVARGVIGQVWRLETDRGTWAVKEWFEPPHADELEAPARFQEAAQAAGVPSPPIVRAADGALLAQVAGTTTRIQGWVDLRDRDPMLDPVEVGRLVAALHQVPFEGGPPVDPWYAEPVGRQAWERLAEMLALGQAPFAGRLAAALDELNALDALVVAPRDVRMCHRDLWADNLRSTASGEPCLIDWEDCGLADPSMELASVVWEFGQGDPARARAVHEAYVSAGGPGRVRDESDFSMGIAQLGHIGQRACTDWLRAGATDEERAFAAEWFGEFVDEPLTRDTIAMLLDAVGG
jgi:aminoglycoside phosphotransferase (APT) family kinase protein